MSANTGRYNFCNFFPVVFSPSYAFYSLPFLQSFLGYQEWIKVVIVRIGHSHRSKDTTIPEQDFFSSLRERSLFLFSLSVTSLSSFPRVVYMRALIPRRRNPRIKRDHSQKNSYVTYVRSVMKMYSHWLDNTFQYLSSAACCKRRTLQSPNHHCSHKYFALYSSRGADRGKTFLAFCSLFV